MIFNVETYVLIRGQCVAKAENERERVFRAYISKSRESASWKVVIKRTQLFFSLLFRYRYILLHYVIFKTFKKNCFSFKKKIGTDISGGIKILNYLSLFHSKSVHSKEFNI